MNLSDDTIITFEEGKEPHYAARTIYEPTAIAFLKNAAKSENPLPFAMGDPPVYEGIMELRYGIEHSISKSTPDQYTFFEISITSSKSYTVAGRWYYRIAAYSAVKDVTFDNLVEEFKKEPFDQYYAIPDDLLFHAAVEFEYAMRKFK